MAAIEQSVGSNLGKADLSAARELRTLVQENGLTIMLVLLFLGSIVGHMLTGWRFQNEQLQSHGKSALTLLSYLTDPQFLSTVFENWESEFLQMSAYVVLTSVLSQRGSAESKDPDAPVRRGDTSDWTAEGNAPEPLRRGVGVRWIYAHSLGLTLFGLFAVSFVLHWVFSAHEAAEEAANHGEPLTSTLAHLTSAQLWFESFQNWQSEFLSTAVTVVLSIFLRQQGSPESKPVAAPHCQTGT